MGLFESVTEVLEAPFKVAGAVVSGVKDGASFVEHVTHRDMGGAVTDLRKLAGDAADLSEGLATLGAGVGSVPIGMGMSRLADLAESKILSAAQMTIDGMKATTGSGTPYTGDEFRDSSHRLESVVDTLVDAAPHSDRWDGTAAQVYTALNASHRRVTSEVQVGDEGAAGILDTEAGQVARTRQTLEDQKDWLKKYDLATSWMNVSGPLRALKVVMDVGAAAEAVGVAQVTMTILVKNSLENAFRLNKLLDHYAHAQKDTSGNPIGTEIFPVPKDPLATKADRATPMPERGSPVIPPTRSQPGSTYTTPSPEEPLPSGPPATPYGTPAPPATSGAAPNAAKSGSPPVPPRTPASTQAPAVSGARAATPARPRAPVDVPRTTVDQPETTKGSP